MVEPVGHDENAAAVHAIVAFCENGVDAMAIHVPGDIPTHHDVEVRLPKNARVQQGSAIGAQRHTPR